MGRREAWSTSKPSDTRTKPTRWEFYNGRQQIDENIGTVHVIGDARTYSDETRRIRSAEEHQLRAKIKNNRTAKDDTHLSFHNSRTNLINDRDVCIEDIADEHELVEGEHHEQKQLRCKKESRQQRKDYDCEEVVQSHPIDDESIRRHEIDRGSDIDYNIVQSSIRNEREFFIKNGNVEILQLMTRDKAIGKTVSPTDGDNIYVNVPLKSKNVSQPQLHMVDNSGKEILMRRFIEEQPDGRQIIREHYQIVPGANYIESMPNEIQQNSTIKGDTFPLGKTGPNSVVYSQTEPEIKVIYTQLAQEAITDSFSNQMQPATSNQSLTQELENSLNQQNELLRQILMEKVKKETTYVQHDVALETQSLPGQSMAIGTQTECEAGTQTEMEEGLSKSASIGLLEHAIERRARSENDDSASEEERCDYIRLHSHNSPEEAVYCIKRRRPRWQKKYLNERYPRKRIVMVEEVKRKIRTPIKEENDEECRKVRKRSIPKKPPRDNGENNARILRQVNTKENPQKRSCSQYINKEQLNCDILIDIPDSFDEIYDLQNRQKKCKIRDELKCRDSQTDKEECQQDNDDGNYFSDSNSDEIVIESNVLTSARSEVQNMSTSQASQQHQFEIHVNDNGGSGDNTITTRQHSNSRPSSKQRCKVLQEAKPHLFHSGSLRASKNSQRNVKKTQTASEPPKFPTSITKYHSNGKHSAQIMTTEVQESRDLQTQTDLLEHNDRYFGKEKSGSIPKYMEWYYGRKKPSVGCRTSTDSLTKESSLIRKVPFVANFQEKKSLKTRFHIKHFDAVVPIQDDVKYKPETVPRKPHPKSSKSVKEDNLKIKQLKKLVETETNHPLVQHSEHRFERVNNFEAHVPPTKLPHYIYPETPPTFSDSKEMIIENAKPKQSPIKQNKVKISNSSPKVNLYIGTADALNAITSQNSSTASAQKQLNAATLEDDHDSGIAMNSLLNSMGRRNPIAEKKSVFSIAYDDVSRVQKITSGGESPPQY